MLLQEASFRHVRKIAISDYQLRHVSVRPSAWNNSVPIGKIVMKFDVLSIYRKPFEEIKILLKCDKTDVYITQTFMYIYHT